MCCLHKLLAGSNSSKKTAKTEAIAIAIAAARKMNIVSLMWPIKYSISFRYSGLFPNRAPAEEQKRRKMISYVICIVSSAICCRSVATAILWLNLWRWNSFYIIHCEISTIYSFDDDLKDGKGTVCVALLFVFAMAIFGFRLAKLKTRDHH